MWNSSPLQIKKKLGHWFVSNTLCNGYTWSFKIMPWIGNRAPQPWNISFLYLFNSPYSYLSLELFLCIVVPGILSSWLSNTQEKALFTHVDTLLYREGIYAIVTIHSSVLWFYWEKKHVYCRPWHFLFLINTREKAELRSSYQQSCLL